MRHRDDSPSSSGQQQPKSAILVVDDEPTLRELLSEALIEDGNEVVGAATGTEAIEQLRKSGGTFDIVVTDLKLPGANGIQVLQEARALNPQTAVIVMTGYATVENAVECMKAGAYDYTTKPLKLDELRMVVRRATERVFLLREAEQKKHFEELSRLDGLTQLFNHRYFLQSLDAEIERAKRGGRSLPLLMIDIDDFKKVNDAYGHQTGDYVLKELARLLISTTRRTDHVARYGGEEFAVILTETDKERAPIVAERIRKTVASHDFQVRGTREHIQLSVSVGIAAHPQDAADAEELVSKADQALYAAKAAGKNHISIYSE